MSYINEFYEDTAERFWDPELGPVGRDIHTLPLIDDNYSGNFLEYGILNTTFDLMNMGINTLIVSDAVTSLTYQANTFIKGSITHGLTKLRSTGETLELINNINANNLVKL